MKKVRLARWMYQNGRTRELQEKYDMATLLFYRLLEMIEQKRLQSYGLYVSDMKYDQMIVDTERCPEYKNLSAKECVNTQ